MEKILVLGASKGLGASVVEELTQYRPQFLLVARNESRLQELVQILAKKDCSAEFQKCDVFQISDQEELFKRIEQFKPDRIINLIGGGPYGNYSEKEWKDHAWAFQVTFLFSARLLHFSLSSKSLSNLKQIVFTGSGVAEDKADPRASSYSAAKHALKGLVYSVQSENPDVDLRLYSPPYMDTDMLPRNAWPRQSKVQSPRAVAQHMVRWILGPSDGKFHKHFEEN